MEPLQVITDNVITVDDAIQEETVSNYISDDQCYFNEWNDTSYQEWYIYDSMNDPNNCCAASQVFQMIYPQKNWEKLI
ncbi:unnamed protein product [Brachionus calyciflorus]|uniref:Uncharacterized protein n=1 Tax=Brachionus calyciflorus TaxID=104777 RepID=A0A814CDJ0_9BILA|nr:unnamed protein product [Brachionus calyciflorus]